MQFLNPDNRHSDFFLDGWKCLASSYSHLLECDADTIEEEFRSFRADFSFDRLDKDRIDVWWVGCKYKNMKIVAKAALSVFSGPVVEGAFSGMKDVIKKSLEKCHQNFSAVSKLLETTSKERTQIQSLFLEGQTFHFLQSRQV